MKFITVVWDGLHVFGSAYAHYFDNTILLNPYKITSFTYSTTLAHEFLHHVFTKLHLTWLHDWLDKLDHILKIGSTPTSRD